MDNFMDKISQKLNSQEIIRANAAADAAALENLERQVNLFKEQMVKYDDCLQEMRRLNLKNIESAQEVHKLADTANEKLGQTAEEVETLSVSKIKETTEFSIAGINKTLNESLAKIAEIKENPDSIELLTKDLSEIQSKLEGLFKNLEDYLHTDNVKVYRNVQAAMTCFICTSIIIHVTCANLIDLDTVCGLKCKILVGQQGFLAFRGEHFIHIR